MKSEIELALNAHTAWRAKFKDFLNGKASFNIDSIGVTDQCEFGRWLDHEGYRMIPGTLRDEIVAAHQEFHLVAADIVRKIKEKRFAEAKTDISQDGALNQASKRLRELLLKLSLRGPGAVAPYTPSDREVDQQPSGAGSASVSASEPAVASESQQPPGNDGAAES